MPKQTGRVGFIQEDAVVGLGDKVKVFRGDEEVATEVVDGLGRFVAGAGDVKIG